MPTALMCPRVALSSHKSRWWLGTRASQARPALACAVWQLRGFGHCCQCQSVVLDWVSEQRVVLPESVLPVKLFLSRGRNTGFNRADLFSARDLLIL